METTTKTLNQKLQEFKDTHGMTNRELAKLFDTQESNISRWLHNHPIGRAWSKLIEQGMGI